jgi:hypothetical protein
MKLFKYPLFVPRAIRGVECVKEDITAWEYIGAGMIRTCYRVPGKMECVKFYRTTEAPQRKWKLDTYFRIHLTRHLFWFNINMQEWRYYERLKKRLPADLMGVFPETMAPLYSPHYGWGVKEALLLNYDGSPVRSVAWEMRNLKDRAKQESLFGCLRELCEQLVKHTVAMHDPQNILLQWVAPDVYRLRVVDFEPRTKALIPGLTYISPYIRRRVRNRCLRYLNHLKQEILK